jgi:hypothetical protein
MTTPLPVPPSDAAISLTETVHKTSASAAVLTLTQLTRAAPSRTDTRDAEALLAQAPDARDPAAMVTVAQKLRAAVETRQRDTTALQGALKSGADAADGMTGAVSQRAALNAVLAANQADAQKRAGVLTGTLDTARAELSRLAGVKDALTNELASLGQQVASQQALVEGLKVTAAALQAQLDQLNATVDKARAAVSFVVDKLPVQQAAAAFSAVPGVASSVNDALSGAAGTVVGAFTSAANAVASLFGGGSGPSTKAWRDTGAMAECLALDALNVNYTGQSSGGVLDDGDYGWCAANPIGNRDSSAGVAAQRGIIRANMGRTVGRAAAAALPAVAAAHGGAYDQWQLRAVAQQAAQCTANAAAPWLVSGPFANTQAYNGVAGTYDSTQLRTAMAACFANPACNAVVKVDDTYGMRAGGPGPAQTGATAWGKVPGLPTYPGDAAVDLLCRRSLDAFTPAKPLGMYECLRRGQVTYGRDPNEVAAACYADPAGAYATQAWTDAYAALPARAAIVDVGGVGNPVGQFKSTQVMAAEAYAKTPAGRLATVRAAVAALPSLTAKFEAVDAAANAYNGVFDAVTADDARNGDNYVYLSTTAANDAMKGFDARLNAAVAVIQAAVDAAIAAASDVEVKAALIKDRDKGVAVAAGVAVDGDSQVVAQAAMDAAHVQANNAKLLQQKVPASGQAMFRNGTVAYPLALNASQSVSASCAVM